MSETTTLERPPVVGLADKPEEETKLIKPPPRVALFLAQPFGTLVGEGKPFANLGELCSWARNEAGYEAVTVPACSPFVDIGKVISSPAYRDDIRAFYNAHGTPLIRLEAHTDGQLMLVHPAELARYRGFGPDDLKLVKDVSVHEAAAEKRMLDIVTASSLLGLFHVVAFSGNRAWTVAKYPWSAWTVKFRLFVLLLILSKWLKVFKRAAELRQKIGFEIHPEEDLFSSKLLRLLYLLARDVDPAAATAIKANYDASHRTLARDSATLDAQFLKRVGLLAMCHLKDAQVRSDEELILMGNEGASIHGDFEPRWSDSVRRFCTFGTGQSDWKRIIPILLAVHQEQPEGLDFVVEGECSLIPNMLQALKIGAENARRARDGRALVDMATVTLEPAQGNWEDFCASNEDPCELLAMNADERAAVETLRQLVRPETAALM